MVRQASSNDHRSWGALPSSVDMILRRVSSVFLMAGVLMTVTPFSPFSWLFPSDGPELLDNFLSMPILVGAVYFQWRVSGVVGSLVVNILDNGLVYSHKMYWTVAAVQAAVMMAVQWGEHELWRRFASVGILAGLWAVGWAATPAQVKREAWEQLKWIWTMMAFQEARSLVRGGRRRW